MKKPVLTSVSMSALLMLVLLAPGGCGGGAGGFYGPPPPATPSPTKPASSGLPSDIPIYPNAQLIGKPAANQATFQAPADQQTVKNFFQRNMPQQGWKAGQVEDNGADGIFLTFTKDTRTVHINISPGSAPGASTLIITVDAG
jgi:hypothetical protein